jgi:hypothetical protein
MHFYDTLGDPKDEQGELNEVLDELIFGADQGVPKESVIIYDDMGEQLTKNKRIGEFAKQNRHSHCTVLYSCQYYVQLPPGARSQMDCAIIFKGQSEDIMKKIHSGFDIALDFDIFYTLYKKATEKDFQFFFIDIRKGEFRIGFNTKFNIIDDEDEEE